MKITPAELNAELKADRSIAVIDVRTPAEYEEIHIPGSMLIPLDRLDSQAIRSAAEGADRCVIVCRSGTRSAQAAGKLEGVVPGVCLLAGGVEAWDHAGHPVNRGRATISLERQVRIGAGALVLLGVILGLLVHPGFFALSAFVGAGLMFAGITDWCGMGLLLARMPWNQRP